MTIPPDGRLPFQRSVQQATSGSAAREGEDAGFDARRIENPVGRSIVRVRDHSTESTDKQRCFELNAAVRPGSHSIVRDRTVPVRAIKVVNVCFDATRERQFGLGGIEVAGNSD
jgi:hypothetical protein